MNCLKMVEVVELEDQYDYRPFYLYCNLQVIFLSFFAEFVIQLLTDAWGVIDL